MAARTPTNKSDLSDDPKSAPVMFGNRFKRLLLGLPCSQCMAYYEAERTTCPICGCRERLGAVAETRFESMSSVSSSTEAICRPDLD